MKSWIKAVLWILVLFVVFVFLYCFGHPNAALRTPGPTCDTYYYQRDLRRCPHKYEFDVNMQTCTPIGEDGCTAKADPRNITVADFDCDKHRYVRDLNHPCNVVRDCNSDRIFHTAQGQCYELGNPFHAVDCINVPGCRHLSDVYINNETLRNNATAHTDSTCPSDTIVTNTYNAVDVIAQKASEYFSEKQLQIQELYERQRDIVD